VRRKFDTHEARLNDGFGSNCDLRQQAAPGQFQTVSTARQFDGCSTGKNPFPCQKLASQLSLA
jgi:hypothetical protein